MSIINSISRFARSPQGRRTADKAMRFAKSPQGKRKIAQLRQRFAAKGGRPR